MMEFILDEILLLSLKEEKARKIQFNPQRTVIIGSNSTGKSCLLKSIYRAFGAEPHKLHPGWKAANVMICVRFSISERKYSILRNNDTYYLFNADDRLITSINKVSDLAVIIADLFDFKIQITDRTGEIITPPPAYLFLPYYLDQDNSWTQNWKSFTKLYLPNRKVDLVNYHTGIRPNKYYDAKSELMKVNDNISNIDKEIIIIKNLLKNLNKKISATDFSIDLDDFQQQVTDLLISCEELNKEQNKLKEELSHLYNVKINIEAQIQITKKAMIETQKDYEFAVTELIEEVPCPSCGAVYENSFSERFGIAKDEQRCIDLLFELEEDMRDVNEKIAKVNECFLSNSKSITEIEKALEYRKEKIKLKDVIENEGKKEMKNIFFNEIEEYNVELKERLLLKRDLEEELKKYENKKRGDEIRSEYRYKMKKYLEELKVYSLPESSYKRIDCEIKESGSAMPRALMAYYYAILNIIRKYGSSSFCPILIDSPNQQGQDNINLPILLNFIKLNQPEHSQLILAIEEDHGIKFEGKIIRLNNKRSLLLKEEYDEVFNNLKPYLTETLGS